MGMEVKLHVECSENFRAYHAIKSRSPEDKTIHHCQTCLKQSHSRGELSLKTGAKLNRCSSMQVIQIQKFEFQFYTRNLASTPFSGIPSFWVKAFSYVRNMIHNGYTNDYTKTASDSSNYTPVS